MSMQDRPFGPEMLARLTLDTEPWLSCDDCFRHVDEYVEHVLAGDTAWMPAMPVHLRGCPACAEEASTVLLLAAEDSGVDAATALAALEGGDRSR